MIESLLLTTARTHRGTSGAPVVMHDAAGDALLPWKLLGVHSACMEMAALSLPVEESLGLNCAWYAGILLTLTAEDALDMTHAPAIQAGSAQDTAASRQRVRSSILPAGKTAPDWR